MQHPVRYLAAAAASIVLLGAACSSRSGVDDVSRDATSPPGAAVTQVADQGGDQAQQASSQNLSVAGVVQIAQQAVVRIETDMGAYGEGVGTGFFVGSDGHIMTNNHVIEAADGSVATSITVTTFDGATYPATVVGRDPQTDTALIKIDATGMQTLSFADGDDVAVGEDVVAMGFPLDLQGGEESGVTVTTGIVSAKNRAIQEPGGAILGAIQTDAAINHGNSGGPLLNMKGQVVGMNTAIASNPDPSGGVAPGIGFAIGSDTLAAVHDALLKDGTVNRGFLGIRGFAAVRPAEAREMGIPEDGGVKVGEVEPTSPVGTAGLQSGDVIVKLGDTPIHNEADLAVSLIRNTAGSTVPLQFYRGSELKTIDVTLGTYPTTTQ